MRKFRNELERIEREKLVEIIYRKNNIKEIESSKIKYKNKRKIAIEISYEGFEYFGVQEDVSGLTISEVLKNALIKTDLADETDLEEIEFCGRTDAGVSASKMVVSLMVKSKYKKVPREFDVVKYKFNDREMYSHKYVSDDFAITTEDLQEMPFDAILNRVLPESIRINGWAPVPFLFSARHDCRERSYKYFFIYDEDIEDFRKPKEILLKMNNFYNLSKHSNPKAIYDFSLNSLSYKRIENDICSMEIKSYFFLHNMVRKIFFWSLRCVKTGRIDFKDVENASSHGLVFSGAKFDFELNFIRKSVELERFVRKRSRNKMAIKNEITKYINES